jgi:cobalt/nickel transport system permease protein/energy-coupling factor transport system permease protein
MTATSSQPVISVIDRINPLTKVVVIVVVMVMGLMSGPWFVVGMLVAGLVAVGLNHKLGNFTKLFLIAIVPVSLILFVLNIVANTSGEVLWHWWIVTISRPGLSAAIHFTARFMVIGLGVMLIMNTGNLRRFCRDLEQRGVSSRATYVIQSTALILPQFANRGSVILDAQRARGIETDSNVFVRMKALLPSAAPLILSTLTGVSERAVSLEARGMTMTGTRTSLIQVADTTADKVVRWLALVALVAFLGWKVWLWTK